MNRSFLPLLLTFLISGCAAIGPSSSADFPQLVAKAVPKADGNMVIFGTANWLPNTRGFSAVRSSFLSSPAAQIAGVLVVTNTAILFQQWEPEVNGFGVIKRLPYEELTASSMDSMGLGRRLVLQKKDFSFETFEFTKAGGNLADSAKTEEAVVFLGNQIRRVP